MIDRAAARIMAAAPLALAAALLLLALASR